MKHEPLLIIIGGVMLLLIAVAFIYFKIPEQLFVSTKKRPQDTDKLLGIPLHAELRLEPEQLNTSAVPQLEEKIDFENYQPKDGIWR